VNPKECCFGAVKALVCGLHGLMKMVITHVVGQLSSDNSFKYFGYEGQVADRAVIL
jgi:hypothetical protein